MLALRAECLETGLLSSMEARRSNPVATCFICSEACGTEVIPAFYPMVFNMTGLRSAGDAEMPFSAKSKAVSTKQSESGLFHCRFFRQAKRVVHVFHEESRPWGSGLLRRVRSTRLAWGAATWRQAASKCDDFDDYRQIRWR